MARTFSRREFYDLVWSKPITRLAKEFSLSDVAVHKICRKHEVPTSPLGWWAKKTAGKPVTQTRCPVGICEYPGHQEHVGCHPRSVEKKYFWPDPRGIICGIEAKSQ